MGEDSKGLLSLGKVNHHLVGEIVLRDKRNDYTLDVDTSIIESEKEETGVTYKREKGSPPQMDFLFEAGLILGDEFRDGNVPAKTGAVNFVDRCFAAMPRGKSIIYLRSNSAFYQSGVINLYFERDRLFTITADQDKGVKETIKTIKEWRPYKGDRRNW